MVTSLNSSKFFEQNSSLTLGGILFLTIIPRDLAASCNSRRGFDVLVFFGSSFSLLFLLF